MMASVTLLSIPVILLVPYAFEGMVDRIARRATRSTRARGLMKGGRAAYG